MIEIEKVHPLIVPKSYIESGTWNLPHYPLPVEEFIICWVKFEEALLYLSQEEMEYLDQHMENWQQMAVDNVRNTRYFNQYEKRDEQDNLQWIAFVNDEDTISSSKVLLEYELLQIFQQGYLVAIPDRACGIVISTTCQKQELQAVTEMIEDMYKKATTPMSPRIYSAADFRAELNWSIPIYDEPTNSILAQFKK